jgi:hypothetical protein
LIKEGLKEVMIPAIHQSDADVFIAHPLGAFQTREPAAEDKDMLHRLWICGRCHHKKGLIGFSKLRLVDGGMNKALAGARCIRTAQSSRPGQVCLSFNPHALRHFGSNTVSMT